MSNIYYTHHKFDILPEEKTNLTAAIDEVMVTSVEKEEQRHPPNTYVYINNALEECTPSKYIKINKD